MMDRNEELFTTTNSISCRETDSLLSSLSDHGPMTKLIAPDSFTMCCRNAATPKS